MNITTSVAENGANVLRVLDPEGGVITELPVSTKTFDEDIQLAEQISKAYADNWSKVLKERSRMEGESTAILSLLEKRNS